MSAYPPTREVTNGEANVYNVLYSDRSILESSVAENDNELQASNLKVPSTTAGDKSWLVRRVPQWVV